MTTLRTNHPTNGWQADDANQHAIQINANTTAIATLADEILEFANLAGFPATGAVGKLYLALDTNKLYRWSTSVYAEVSPSAGGGSGGTPDDGSVTATKVAPATLVTAAEGIAANNNDTTWPTSAAVKAYADSVGGTGTPADGSVTATKIAAATLVTAAETIAANNTDTTIPTSAAVKQYTDAAVAGVSGGTTDVAAVTHAATSKTTPVDADEFPISDSAAAYALKKVTFLNLRLWIAAFYNTVAAVLTNKSIDLATNTLTGTMAQFDAAVSNGNIYYQGSTDVALGDGGTGASLTAPAGDRIMFYDQSSGQVDWLTVGANLTVTGTSIAATSSGGTVNVIASYKTIADYVGPNSPNPTYPALNLAGGDWTDAINFMIADTHGNSSGVGGDLGYAILPAGKGVWSGATPLGSLNVNIRGQGRWHTILSLSTSFISVGASATGTFQLEGLSIFGGTNPVTVGTATDQGGRFRIIRDVEFHGCSGTSIRITGSDTPYFHLENITFDGAANSTGFSIVGFTDAMILNHLEFRSYKIGMKIGAVMQRALFQACHFMHVSETSAAPRYDIWIVPSVNAGGLASGIGATFRSMWHGSEGRASNDRFVIVADDNGSGLPKDTTDSTGYFWGVCFEDIAGFYVADGNPYVYACMDTTKFKSNHIGRAARRYTPSAYTTSPMLAFRNGGTADGTNVIIPWMDGFTTTVNPDVGSSVSVSVDSEVVLFNGTTGKSLKRATGTGLMRLVSGVASAVTPTVDGQTLDGSGNITVIAPGTNAATSKATPVDADSFPIVDSAASNVLKKVTFANLKAWFKAYYDTVASVLTNKDLTSGTNTFPTFNQNTTGSAAKLTTPRTISGVAFDGSTNIALAFPYDVSAFAFGAQTVRAAGAGDNPMGIRIARACTLTSVTYRGSTADASGNLIVELRKNGAAVSGTSKTIAAADQTAGGANATATGSWAFAAGDILTVYVTSAAGTTPGKGLVADITGTA